MSKKPIRVFASDLSDQVLFFATQHYKSEIRNGKEFVEITGKKYDVTQDVARCVTQFNVEFTRVSEYEATTPDSPAGQGEGGE